MIKIIHELNNFYAISIIFKSKISIFWIVIIFFYTSCSFAQEKLIGDSLLLNFAKIYAKEKDVIVGGFKIISLDTIKIHKEEYSTQYRIKYKNTVTFFEMLGRAGKFVCVKDGKWIYKNEKGETEKEEMWDGGVLIKSKYFDENKKLISDNYTDFEKNISISDEYAQNRLIERSINQKDTSYTLYYPNDNLILEVNYFNFFTLFTKENQTSRTITFTAKNNLTLLDVKYKNNKFKVSSFAKKLPYKLTKNEKITFNLTFSPTTSNNFAEDILEITTNEPELKKYEIESCGFAYHIDAGNVDKVKHLTLSKSKDKFLLVRKMGTVTDMYLTDSKGIKKKYPANESINSFDLNKFVTGEYDVKIISCNEGGRFKLIILD